MYNFPYRWYAATIAAFLTIFGALAARIQHDPKALAQSPPAREIFLLGVATFRLSRLASKDRVAVLRQPFVHATSAHRPQPPGAATRDCRYNGRYSGRSFAGASRGEEPT